MKEKVSFKSQGTRCAAWVFRPDGAGPFPLVVMAHGLAAVKEMRLDAFAERLCGAGYVCLVFDYRHFGESEGEPRQLLSIGKQHQDWREAVRFGQCLPDVDPKKIVLWGTSFGGGHVLKIGSEFKEVVAIISQVPHLSGLSSLRMNSLPKILALTLHGLYDGLRAAIGLKPHYVLSSAEPDHLALMNAPNQSQGYLGMVPEGMTLDQRVAARFGLFVGLYSPVSALRKLTVPVLMQVGINDVITPAAPAYKAASRYPNVDLKKYDSGHFEPYFEPLFSTVVGDQVAFLANRLGTSGKSGE